MRSAALVLLAVTVLAASLYLLNPRAQPQNRSSEVNHDVVPASSTPDERTATSDSIAAMPAPSATPDAITDQASSDGPEAALSLDSAAVASSSASVTSTQPTPGPSAEEYASTAAAQTATVEEEARVTVPVILVQPPADFVADDETQAQLELMRQKFVESVGEPGDDPDAYRSRWEKAQESQDAHFQAMFGDEAFNALQQEAVTQQP